MIAVNTVALNPSLTTNVHKLLKFGKNRGMLAIFLSDGIRYTCIINMRYYAVLATKGEII